MSHKRFWMFVGNTAKPPHNHIFVCEFKPGMPLATPRPAAPADNPNFLAVHPSGRFLYAVTAANSGGYAGSIEAFAIDHASGSLTLLNRQPSGGENPAHLAVHPAGNWAFVANYHGATVAVFSIDVSGKLSPASQIVRHHGASVHPGRQTKPYPHGITLNAAGNTVHVCDLGTDSIETYRFDAHRGELKPLSSTKLPPGSGPRHLALSKDNRFAYVINELSCTIAVFELPDDSPRQIQLLSPWSPIDPSHSGAEIELHPAGRFLYASNRGYDNLAICEVNKNSGKLSLLGHQPTLGQTPRHFAIDPSGEFLVAENLRSDSLVLFQIDGSTGKLRPAGTNVPSHAPLCVVFVPIHP